MLHELHELQMVQRPESEMIRVYYCNVRVCITVCNCTVLNVL